MYLLPKLVFLLTIIGASYCHDNDQQKYLVCRPLDSLFEQQPSSSLNQSTLRGPPGRPGKRGPPGDKGEQGQPGPVVPQPLENWTRIDNRIHEIINVSLASFPEVHGSKNTALVNWTRIDSHIHKIINEQRICAGVVYKDHCYWLPWIVATYSGHSGKSEAANACRSYGATLVDIETKEQYDVLYLYIQKAWLMYVDQKTLDFVYVWLASSYTNGNAVSSTGGSVYTRWHIGHPKNYPGIGWVVGKPTRSASHTGMWTTTESWSVPLPFCRL